jgi:hypothetical protein
MSLQQFLAWSPVLSGILLLAAVAKTLAACYLQMNGSRAEGIVIKMDTSNEGITPIIEFQAKDSKKYRFPVKMIRGKEGWAVGVKCPVLYDPAKPKQALVDAPIQRWGMVHHLSSLQ